MGLESVDPAGLSAIAIALPVAGASAAVDGPIPLGDIVGIVILLVAGGMDIVAVEDAPFPLTDDVIELRPRRVQRPREDNLPPYVDVGMPPKDPQDDGKEEFCKYERCGRFSLLAGEYVTRSCGLSYGEGLAISWVSSENLKCLGLCEYKCRGYVQCLPDPVYKGERPVEQGILLEPVTASFCVRTPLRP